jgi:urease accessory protein
MIGQVVQDLGGWWSGVLHPLESYHLVLMLMVGVLAGIATTQGREPWVGPLAYVAGTFIGMLAAFAGLEVPFLDGAIVAGLVVGVALMFAPPPRMSSVLPIAAALGGLLHGLSYRDPGDRGGLAPYVMGFLFTTVLLQAFGAITGSVIGRSVAARRTVAVCAAAATLAVLIA